MSESIQMEKKGSKAKVNRHTWKKVIKEVEGFFFFQSSSEAMFFDFREEEKHHPEAAASHACPEPAI